MLRVYKYELEMDMRQTVSLPRHAEFLKVDEQGGKLCLWALVSIDPNAEIMNHPILIAGTGHDIEGRDDLLHIDSVLMGNGLVFHVFIIDK